jgi:hypothetical protein
MGRRSTASQPSPARALTLIRHGQALRSHPIATIIKVFAGVVAVLLVSTTSVILTISDTENHQLGHRPSRMSHLLRISGDASDIDPVG